MPRDITGEEGRSRSRKSATSCLTSVDSHVSEWGNPMSRSAHDPMTSKVVIEKRTRGIETSQYPQEKKSSTRYPK